MIEVPLTKGHVTLVDDEDADLVLGQSWCASTHNGRIYAQGSDPANTKRRVFLHRWLFGEPVGVEIDHRNGDTLDNRRGNLRPATRAHQSANSRKQSAPTSSRYKGVTWFKRDGRWRAQIKNKGIYQHLGYYDSEEDAARAYDQAAVAAWGEYARVNL